MITLPTTLTRSANFRVGAAALLLVGAAARTAEACSMAAPWAIRDTTWIGFIGTATADTVHSGPGSIRPIVAPGHSGLGGPREIFGQRVRLDQLGEYARRTLPAGASEAVLVPWDFAADCRTVAWSRSAQWLAPGTHGLFRAHLRPRDQWAGGLPTFDISTTAQQPYPQVFNAQALRHGVGAARPRLTAEELLLFLDRMPPRRDAPDSIASLTEARAIGADSAFAAAYPVSEVLFNLRYEYQEARKRAMRHPLAGTFRFEFTRDGVPMPPLFVRTSVHVSSVQEGGTSRDSAFVPRIPQGYYVQAAGALSLERLAKDCTWRADQLLAYVDLDWHPPVAADGTGRWIGGLDDRLFEALLPADSVRAWRARKSAAMQQRFDSVRALPPPANRLEFVPTRTLRFEQPSVGPMRIEGDIPFDQFGVVRVRGERISAEVLPCEH